MRRMLLVLAVLGAVTAPVVAPVLAQQAPLRLTLQEAIERAHARGPVALAAKATRDAARARDRAFGADLMPQVALSGTVPAYNRSIIPVLQQDGSTLFRPQEQSQSDLNMAISQRIPFTGGDLFINSGLSRIDRVGTLSSRTFQTTPVQIGIRQDILRPNRQRWDNREQALRADVAERAYKEALEDISITTANSFFDYYTAKLGLENAAANASVNDTLYTLNKGRFEVGKIGENDLLQSELALLRAQVSLDGARLEHDRTLASLRLLLDLPRGAPLEIVVPNDIPDVVADTVTAVQMAQKHRAQMLELELQEVQADRRIAEARFGSGFGGTLTASMGLNQSAGTLDQAYRDLREAQRFQVGVSLPIVQWGGRSANIQAARLDGDRVDYLARQTREQTAQEAHFAALGLAQARRQLSIAAKADTVGAKRFEVAKNRYVIGRIGIDNLYLAQAEKDAALGQYLQSLRGYWVAYYRLRRVTMFDFATGAVIR